MDADLKGEIELLNERSMWEPGKLKRDAFAQVQKDLKSGMIALVCGLRRTGKTYLAKQLLFEQEKPFYFSFDKLAFQKPSVLEGVIRHALSQKAQTIALDEVQKVEGWSGILKSYYDHFRPKPSFLVSGSSSIQLKKGGESLAGRVLEHCLLPLSCSEYLRFGEMGGIFARDYAGEYMAEGAFPEVVLHGREPARYARSIVDKIIGEDIPKLYSVEHPEHLPDIVKMLAERAGQGVDYRDIGAGIGISKDTAKRYVFLLEKSFLVDIVQVFGKHGKGVPKSKKVYFAHPQIAAAYARQDEGFIAEGAVYLHLKPFGKIGFWRSGRREIDFILERAGGIVPIEVKYCNSVGASDTRTIRTFMEKRKADGIVVTKNDSERIAVGGRTLRLVPLHEFLAEPEASLQPPNSF